MGIDEFIASKVEYFQPILERSKLAKINSVNYGEEEQYISVKKEFH